MYLRLFKNPKELWNEVKNEIKEGEAALSINPDKTGYLRIESLKELEKVEFPVVVKTSTDYDAVGIPTHHTILTQEVVEIIKREIVDEVLTPYFDILKKKKS